MPYVPPVSCAEVQRRTAAASAIQPTRHGRAIATGRCAANNLTRVGCDQGQERAGSAGRSTREPCRGRWNARAATDASPIATHKARRSTGATREDSLKRCAVPRSAAALEPQPTGLGSVARWATATLATAAPWPRLNTHTHAARLAAGPYRQHCAQTGGVISERCDCEGPHRHPKVQRHACDPAPRYPSASPTVTDLQVLMLSGGSAHEFPLHICSREGIP